MATRTNRKLSKQAKRIFSLHLSCNHISQTTQNNTIHHPESAVDSTSLREVVVDILRNFGNTSRNLEKRLPGCSHKRSGTLFAAAMLAECMSVHMQFAHAEVGAHALPTQGSVKVGSGSISQSGANMVIKQNSGRMGVDWQAYNIGAKASVTYVQPGRDSVALNRVVGNEASKIYGQLKSNGQVFLTNPNGVLFAPGAKVDVGGIVASSLDMSQKDFAKGKYQFKGTDAAGKVTNHGNIHAASGGYVALFAPEVKNEGSIEVAAGQVVLASGRATTVDITGSGLVSAVVNQGTSGGRIDNSGTLSAPGGTVRMTAKAAEGTVGGLINNAGIVKANTLVEKNGEIWLTGDSITNTGKIHADGDADHAAGKVELAASSKIALNGTVSVDGASGGSIKAIANMTHGQANVTGNLSAKGKGKKGNGGFIETSGAKVIIADKAKVDTRSTSGGKTGTWLVDPNDYTVAASGGDITGATLSTNLGTTSVTLQSSAGGSSGSGNVNINDGVSWSANTILTLTASNNVNVNSTITASGAGAGLAINPNTANGSETASGSGTFNLASGITINLADVPPTSTTALVIGGNPYTVINSLGFAGSTTGTDLQGMGGNLGGYYALGGNIDASATSTWNDFDGFEPIGNSLTESEFTGTFDGLGHTISGLTINRSSTDYVGLFGYSNGSSVVTLV